MRKSIVISASSGLQKEICEWIKYFENNNYIVLDFPKIIEKNRMFELYPTIYNNFFEAIVKSDVFFLLNADKNGIDGYIGAAAFAELCFAVSQNILHNSNKKIYIMKMPNDKVESYKEIKLWLSLKWIEIFIN